MNKWTFDGAWRHFVDFSILYEKLEADGLEVNGSQLGLRLTFDFESDTCCLSVVWYSDVGPDVLVDSQQVDWEKAKAELPEDLRQLVPER